MNTNKTELRRALGPWAAASIVVGTIIGSGIFLVPRTMILRVGTSGMVFFIFAFGGVLSLAGALSYAELAAAMPEAGGEYVYLREAYGPIWGFLYSWTQMWVAKSGSIATLATGFFYYLSNFFPVLDQVFYTAALPLGPKGGPLEFRYGQLLAMALIMGLAWMNYFGVKIGGNVQIAVTVVKVALITFVIIAGLVFGVPNHAATAPLVPLTLFGFVAALRAALWAYDGWNNVSMVSSEIREPQRNLPRALVGGTIAVIAIYLLANAAYFHVLSAAEVAGSTRVAGEMMRRILGQGGANAVAIAAMISIFAALNGSILTGSRVPYAAAREGLFFRAIARVHPQYRTPSVSILALSAWGALLVLSGQYDELLDYVIVASWILYGMTTAAVIVLRVKRPDLSRPYHTPGYPIVPVLFVIASSTIVLVSFFDAPVASVKGLALIVLGIPFYAYWRKRHTAS
jgi:APA family basic amino acid/polyamine antiporter